jgi:hypothetical protein
MFMLIFFLPSFSALNDLRADSRNWGRKRESEGERSLSFPRENGREPGIYIYVVYIPFLPSEGNVLAVSSLSLLASDL